MDRHQDDVLEQYFASSDEASEMPDHHAPLPAVGTAGGRDTPYTLQPYGQLALDGHMQPPLPFFSSDDVILADGQVLTVGAVPQYGFGPLPGEPGHSAASFQTTTSADWQGLNPQQLMFADGPGVSGPAHALLDPFGYMPYGEGTQAHDNAMQPPDHGYAAPADAGYEMNFAYGWETQDAPSLEYDPVPFHSPAAQESASVSPLGMEAGSGTGVGSRAGARASSSRASSSSGGQYSAMYSATANMLGQVASGAGSGAASFVVAEDQTRERTPVPKRVKARHRGSQDEQANASFLPGAVSATPMPRVPPMPPQPPQPDGTAGALRGAGQSPQAAARQQAVQRSSAERKDDRKTRNPHNMVEKQYRNRLNAQFEDLANALPETLKARGGGKGDGVEGAAADGPERKPSKGEVLELVRMHIQSLEQQKASLLREQQGLRSKIQRLQEDGWQGSSGQDLATEATETWRDDDGGGGFDDGGATDSVGAL